VTYLIDGYNLLHAVGWATRKMPSGTLEAARRRLLDWLADSIPLKSGAVVFRVVFDAQKGTAPSVGQSHRGVRVQFAYRRTADDLIEELLDAEPTPGGVTVVSNDGRLHEAAHRQHRLDLPGIRRLADRGGAGHARLAAPPTTGEARRPRPRRRGGGAPAGVRKAQAAVTDRTASTLVLSLRHEQSFA
jgi:hypothetical protein